MRNSKHYWAALEAICDSIEAGKILGVSPKRAKQFAIEGRLAARRLGRDWVFSRQAALDLAKVDRPPGLPLDRPKITKKKSGKKRR